MDQLRPHRVTKCPQKPQYDPTVCHFDWFLTVYVNFEGVARDGWGFQGYRYTQGTFGCNIQAKKITTVYGPPFREFLSPPQTPADPPRLFLAVLRGLPGVARSFEGTVILSGHKGVVLQQKINRMFTTVA